MTNQSTKHNDDQMHPLQRSQIHSYIQRLTGCSHVLMSGRAAAGIWATLRAWDFRDRFILLPANTCYIVLWAVLQSGNHPLLVDVDPYTFSLDPTLLDSTLRAAPAAIIPAHMYGQFAPMKAIVEWASRHHIKVIEDAALAFGASFDGNPAGSWGDVAVFSFGLGKIVDHQVGGAVVANDAVLAREVERLLTNLPRWDDHLLRLSNEWHGLYWPLHQYEACNPGLLEVYPILYKLYHPITCYQLASSDWADLADHLEGLKGNRFHRARLRAVYERAGFSSPSHLPDDGALWKFPLLVEPRLRDALLDYLWENGIQDATRWYPSLRYMTTALAPDAPQKPTPVADSLSERIINLPLSLEMDEADVQRIAYWIIQFIDRHSTDR